MVGEFQGALWQGVDFIACTLAGCCSVCLAVYFSCLGFLVLLILTLRNISELKNAYSGFL